MNICMLVLLSAMKMMAIFMALFSIWQPVSMGFHVIVGTVTLAVMLFRAMAGHFTAKQHFGFEAAAWYWHFVDVVWLFLFACIYVWAQ